MNTLKSRGTLCIIILSSVIQKITEGTLCLCHIQDIPKLNEILAVENRVDCTCLQNLFSTFRNHRKIHILEHIYENCVPKFTNFQEIIFITCIIFILLFAINDSIDIIGIYIKKILKLGISLKKNYHLSLTSHPVKKALVALGFHQHWKMIF